MISEIKFEPELINKMMFAFKSKFLSAMKKVTGCEIFNQIDHKYYTLYVEWFSSDFKIMLLESTMPPLCGKMEAKDINYFCDQLCKPYNEYLDECKRILCGNCNEIQFFIQNKTLQWQRNIWILGKIELHSILDIKVVCENFQQLLKVYQSIENKISALEEENKHLLDTNKELSSKVEKMIEIKTSMEQDLYKKFLAVLNSKKKKIKELNDNVDSDKNIREPVFDAPTDESEESEKEDQIIRINPRLTNKGGKRKCLDNDSTVSLQKTRKTDCVTNHEVRSEASSSKDFTNVERYTAKDCEKIEERDINEGQNCSTETRKSRSSLNFIEEESEEELFSQ